MSGPLPSLRAIQPIPVKAEDGETGYLLQDPMQLVDDVCVLTLPAMAIAQFFDGSRTVDDVRAEILKNGGGVIPESIIHEVAGVLDRYCLLDNETAAIAQRKVLEEFREAPARPAAHAGVAYPEDADEAKKTLDSFFEDETGPGRPGASSSGDADDTTDADAEEADAGGNDPASKLLGVIAPHIDLRCGGPTIAHAYRSLAEAGPFDLAIILGVGHYAHGWPYVATRKNFETPFGTVRTDADFVDRLDARVPFDLLEDELAHIREHSIEFQVLFLQHLYGGTPDFAIVPILCCSFHQAVQSKGQPDEERKVAGFVEALRAEIDAFDGRVVVIAGVDLAHVGHKFGHGRPADEEFVAEVETKDHEMLRHVETGDAKAFHDYIAAENGDRNICGHSAIYTMLRALEERSPKARLLHYDRMREEPTHSAVTFASLAVEAGD